MSFDLGSIQREVLQQQEALLQLLKQEKEFLNKYLLTDKSSQLTSPENAAYHLLEIHPSTNFNFTKEEADLIILDSLQNHDNVGGNIQDIILAKLVEARRSEKLKEEYSLERMSDIRVRMEEIDGKLAAILGPKKMHMNVLPSYSTSAGKLGENKHIKIQKQIELDISEQWKKWSGNYTNPNQFDIYAHESLKNVGEYISVPFKPLYWTTLLAQKAQATNTASADPLLSTKESLHNDIDDENMTMDMFLRSIPWLYMFLYEGINDLEEYTVEETYYQGQVILAENEHMTLNIIRTGEVKVNKANPHNTSMLLPFHTLRKGEAFGFTEDLEATSQFTYIASSKTVTIYSVSLVNIVEIMNNSEIDSSMQEYELKYLKHGLYNEFHNHNANDVTYLQRAQISHLFQDLSHYFRTIQHNYPLMSSFMKLVSLASPSLSFKDIVEDTLGLAKTMLDVDRISIYILDTAYTFMYLYTLGTSDISGESKDSAENKSATIMGLKMPLKGVAAYVAKNNTMLNVVDAYQVEFFDMTMDMRTGYRTKQMLAVPVHNPTGEVIGAIQCINPLVKTRFNLDDEQMLQKVSEILSYHINDLRNKEYTTTSKLGKPSNLFSGVLNCKLLSGYIYKDHHHVKLNAHYFAGGRNPPITRQSKMFTTTSDSMIPQKLIFSANEVIEWNSVRQSDITLQSCVVIETFSRNNHPIGWCCIHLFSPEQRRVGALGPVEYLLHAGPLPSQWMEVALRSNAGQDEANNILYVNETLESHLNERNREFIGSIVLDWGIREQVYYDADYRMKYVPYQNLNYIAIETNENNGIMLQEGEENSLTAQLVKFGQAKRLDRQFMGKLVQTFRFEQTYESIMEIDQNVGEFLSVQGLNLLEYDTRFIFYILMNFDCQYAHKSKSILQWLSSSLLHNYHLLLPLVTGNLQNNRLLSLVANSLYSISPTSHSLVTHSMSTLLQCYLLENTLNNGILYYFLYAIIQAPSVFGVCCYWHVQRLIMFEPLRNQRKLVWLLKDLHRLLPNSISHSLTKGFDLLYQVHMIYFRLFLSGENTAYSEGSQSLYKAMMEQLPFFEQYGQFTLPFNAITHFDRITNLEQHSLLKQGVSVTLADKEEQNLLSLIYLPSYSVRCSLYHDFLQSVDFILSVNEIQLQTLHTSYYHIYGEATFLLDFPRAISMNTLIQDAFANSNQKSTKDKSFFFKNDYAMKKIPEDLITQHLLSLEVNGTHSDPPFDKENALDLYWNSLASYILVAYVLSLQSLSGYNVIITDAGQVFAFYPTEFLGVDDALLSKSSDVTIKVTPRKRLPLYLPPCMIEVICGGNPQAFNDLMDILVSALLCLRKHSYMLLWSLNALCAQYHIRPELREVMVSTLKESLMMDMTDEDAKSGLHIVIQSSLKSDYQIKVKI